MIFLQPKRFYHYFHSLNSYLLTFFFFNSFTILLTDLCVFFHFSHQYFPFSFSFCKAFFPHIFAFFIHFLFFTFACRLLLFTVYFSLTIFFLCNNSKNLFLGFQLISNWYLLPAFFPSSLILILFLKKNLFLIKSLLFSTFSQHFSFYQLNVSITLSLHYPFFFFALCRLIHFQILSAAFIDITFRGLHKITFLFNYLLPHLLFLASIFSILFLPHFFRF